MLMFETVTEVLLPAPSFAVPVTDWPAPWTSVTGVVGQVATPETASEQVKLTVTGVLFQPAAFGAGVFVTPITAPRSSMITASAPVALLPALSVEMHEMPWMPTPATGNVYPPVPAEI